MQHSATGSSFGNSNFHPPDPVMLHLLNLDKTLFYKSHQYEGLWALHDWEFGWLCIIKDTTPCLNPQKICQTISLDMYDTRPPPQTFEVTDMACGDMYRLHLCEPCSSTHAAEFMT